jgi:hypothetical protein
MSQTRPADTIVTLLSGEVYSHRFIQVDYTDSDSVHIVERQTCDGTRCGTETKVVRNLAVPLCLL